MNTSARTAPTVNGSPKVNRRQLRSLEVQLGAFQLAVLLGLVTGSMACAFYLGFFSGQRVGYENALVGSASTLARFALNTKDLGDSPENDLSPESAPKVKALSDEPRQRPLSDNQFVAASATSKQDAPEAPVESAAKTLKDDATSVAVKSENIQKQPAALPAEDELVADEVIRVYGNDRPKREEQKRTSIGALKEEVQLVKDTPRTSPVNVGTARPKVPEKVVEKPQVLAGMLSEQKRSRTDQISNVRKVEAVPVRSILAAGWYAQVAAPRKMADAEALAARLRKNGFPVSIESASVKGEAYYRVIVGPEDNKKQAQVLVEQLKSERSVQGEPFLRSIK